MLESVIGMDGAKIPTWPVRCKTITIICIATGGMSKKRGEREAGRITTVTVTK